jgi:hypothetical protein
MTPNMKTPNMTISTIVPTVLLALTLAGVVQAHDQQEQQTWMNAAVCMLAVRAGALSTRRTGLRELRVPSDGGSSCSDDIGRNRCD